MITHVVIHHSLTPDSGTVSWGAIRDWHTGRNLASPYKWNNIGYHFGVELVGDHFEVLLGRMPDELGAHTKELGMNSRSLGVCLVGNFDLAPPPPGQWQKAAALVRWLRRSFGVPVENVLGHREVGLLAGYDWEKGQYKTCPGKQFHMNAFRNEVR